MRNVAYIKKVCKRVAALLLVAACLLTALPRGAQAVSVGDAVEVHVAKEGTETFDRGVASFVKGDDSKYFTINAVAKKGYVFSHWVASDGYSGTFYGSQLTLPYAKDNDGYVKVIFYAHFRKLDEPNCGVRVQVDPSNPTRGVVSGGKQATDDRTEVTTTITATPVGSAVFSYWTIKSSFKESSDPGYLAFARSMQVTNKAGELLTCTAHFVNGDTAPGVFTAVRLEGDTTGTVVPGSATGDRPYDPSGGIGQQTVLQAFPASDQYIFSHWERTRGNAITAETVSSANPYTVTVEKSRDVYTAVFIATPDNTPLPGPDAPPGASPFPVKPENFKDVWRKFTSPSYGTTRETLGDLARSVIGSIRSRYAGADPDVGSSNAVAMLEEQLDDKVAQKPKDREEMKNLPEATLITSDGESCETDRVATGDYVDVANELVLTRFGSLYDYEIMQSVHVTGPVGMSDREQTMVWKNTGAMYNDRLLLLQFLPDGTHNAVTPIADEAGTMTFTLPTVTACDFLLLRIHLLPLNQ